MREKAYGKCRVCANPRFSADLHRHLEKPEKRRLFHISHRLYGFFLYLID